MTIQKIQQNTPTLLFSLFWVLHTNACHDVLVGNELPECASHIQRFTDCICWYNQCIYDERYGLVSIWHIFYFLRAPYSLPMSEYCVKSQWKQVFLSYSMLFNEGSAACFTSQVLIYSALHDILMTSIYPFLTLLLMFSYKQDIKRNCYICDRCSCLEFEFIFLNLLLTISDQHLI